MVKAEAMKRWQDLEGKRNPLAHMTPIKPKTRGSRYGCCGIRIDGSPEFIDDVLSNLKALIDGENQVTRLELSRQPVTCKEGYKSGQNAEAHAEVCYIRLHVRGIEGAAASAVFDRHLAGATERFAVAQGL